MSAEFRRELKVPNPKLWIDDDGLPRKLDRRGVIAGVERYLGGKSMMLGSSAMALRKAISAAGQSRSRKKFTIPMEVCDSVRLGSALTACSAAYIRR